MSSEIILTLSLSPSLRNSSLIVMIKLLTLFSLPSMTAPLSTTKT